MGRVGPERLRAAAERPRQFGGPWHLSVDIIAVAQLMGHRRIDTTRRHSPPSAADADAAVTHPPTDE
jgi:hypothetical protein